MITHCARERCKNQLRDTYENGGGGYVKFDAQSARNARHKLRCVGCGCETGWLFNARARKKRSRRGIKMKNRRRRAENDSVFAARLWFSLRMQVSLAFRVFVAFYGCVFIVCALFLFRLAFYIFQFVLCWCTRTLNVVIVIQIFFCFSLIFFGVLFNFFSGCDCYSFGRRVFWCFIDCFS